MSRATQHRPSLAAPPALSVYAGVLATSCFLDGWIRLGEWRTYGSLGRSRRQVDHRDDNSSSLFREFSSRRSKSQTIGSAPSTREYVRIRAGNFSEADTPCHPMGFRDAL